MIVRGPCRRSGFSLALKPTQFSIRRQPEHGVENGLNTKRITIPGAPTYAPKLVQCRVQTSTVGDTSKAPEYKICVAPCVIAPNGRVRMSIPAISFATLNRKQWGSSTFGRSDGMNCPLSAMGHKRTFDRRNRISAKGP